MTERLDIPKTHKLFINGQFPRSESGRSLPVVDAKGDVIAHLCRASRKDLRDAVVAARAAQDSWARRDAYNRGQILYRMAEMLEGKRAEMIEALEAVGTHRTPTVREGVATRGKKKVSRRGSPSPTPPPSGSGTAPKVEVSAAIDRLVAFAGWADKFQHVLGCQNPVQGPYHNFTIPEAVGVVGVVAPDAPALLGLVSLIAPAICAGNTVVALGSQSNPIPTCVFGEVCATSDVPAGVVNLLTGERAELLKWMAEHREVDAVHAGGLNGEETMALRLGVAENLKRVVIRGDAGASAPRTRKSASPGTPTVRGGVASLDWFDARRCESPEWIESLVEFKTMWHPAMV